ncbi:MAG: glycoside hydrolase family 88 protein [Acidobacteria bacterium]|nr:glycoside hydrolase family 88 protein [Acidobacteriota bacterium]
MPLRLRIAWVIVASAVSMCGAAQPANDPPLLFELWRGPAVALAEAERQPLDVARVLAARYPENPSMSYIPAVAWSGALRLAALTREDKWKEKPRRDMRPFFSGEKPSIAPPYALTSLAGHLAFVDLAVSDDDAPALALARKAADFILPQSPDEIVRFARGWTDDMFMATTLLARVASRTADDGYARVIGRLLTSYAGKLQRPDGLFIHAVEGPHAWGRGNGFAAMGLADALAYLPESWPDRPRVVDIFRRHMRAMVGQQSDDGAWREVVDEPTAYQELTVTAMTVAAMARGVRRGWLDRELLPVIDRAWQAVLARVADDGALRDVCASTGAGPTKEYYLKRPAINGADDRGGAMALLAALEVEELRRAPR